MCRGPQGRGPAARCAGDSAILLCGTGHTSRRRSRKASGKEQNWSRRAACNLLSPVSDRPLLPMA